MKDYGRHHSFTFSVDVTLLHTSSNIYEEVSWVFQLLSWLHNRFCIVTCTPILEKFISYVYTKNPDYGKNLNEVILLQYSSSAKEGFHVLLPSSLITCPRTTHKKVLLPGCGELNFTDQILLADRVGLISCFEGPLDGGGGRVEVCTV